MTTKERKMPPILSVSGESLPEAWENACIELADKGMVYSRRDPEDNGPQLESYMTTEVRNPDADPFSHLKGGTNALDAPLLDYYLEIMGSKNTWVRDFNNPEDTRWDYMYHERLSEYPDQKNPDRKIDQVKFAIDRLIESPCSRRTNIITWYPERDMLATHTPCLQRIWFQIIAPQGEEDWALDMHYNFRSRNVMDASFGNMHGLYMLGCHVRDRVEKATGKSLAMRMIDNIDSFHVNSHSYKRFKIIARGIKKARERGEPLTERAWPRSMVVDGLKVAREEVIDATLRQTSQHFPGDMTAEEKRVNDIADRVFYLLDKYAPK